MPEPSMTPDVSSSKWSDLVPRILSAVVMAAIAMFCISYGNPAYMFMIAVVIGLGFWELARLVQPEPASVPVILGGFAFVAVVLGTCGCVGPTSVAGSFAFAVIAVVLPCLLGLLLIKTHRVLFLAYGLLIMMAGFGFMVIGPTHYLIWFVLIIIISDVAGYFVGRLLGGPKFWPRISPKKTWSGTIAGWVGALILGFIGVRQGAFGPSEAMIAPFVAFAGQMGDIVQSAIKRKMGVKDSSNLIPGHGGVLDRFDAMIGAAGALMLFAGLGALITSF